MPPVKVKSESFRDHDVKIGEERPGRYVAVAYGGGDRVGPVHGETQQAARAAIRSAILERHADFVGYDGMVNLFLRAYPGGFADPLYEDWERGYKVSAAKAVCTALSRECLDAAMASGDFSGLAKAVKASLKNLLAKSEIISFSGFLADERHHAAFFERLRDLLYGDDTPKAFSSFVDLLSRHGLAKWPVVTYLPFLRFPDRHVFVKPEVTLRCAERLGEDLAYESRPSAELYEGVRSFLAGVRARVQDTLAPRDYIDIQTLIYVVGTPSYLAEVTAERLARSGQGRVPA